MGGGTGRKESLGGCYDSPHSVPHASSEGERGPSRFRELGTQRATARLPSYLTLGHTEKVVEFAQRTGVTWN